MNKLNKYLLTIPLALLIISPVQANSSDHRQKIHQQMHQQTERIKRGIESGRLTTREARVLRNQQRAIRQLARIFRQDGRMTGIERRILHQQIKWVNHKLNRLKRNDHHGQQSGYRGNWRKQESDRFSHSPSRRFNSHRF